MEKNYKMYKITVKSVIEQTFEHYCYSKKNAKIMHEMRDYPKQDIKNNLYDTKVIKMFKPKIKWKVLRQK
jgi:hypothetical protein